MSARFDQVLINELELACRKVQEKRDPIETDQKAEQDEHQKRRRRGLDYKGMLLIAF